MTGEALVQLGQLLSATEASKLAARLDDGATLTQALQAVPGGRRPEIKQALDTAGLGTANRATTVAVLRAIQGAATRTTDITPVWTLPGHLAGYGALTASVKELVLSARQSVTCSTYNFQKTSALWDALRDVACRGTVEVRVYLDTDVAGKDGTPSCDDVAQQLVGASVFRTRALAGKLVRNHAKFVAVDHQYLVVTSANFSVSAEQNNIELGLRVHSRPLTETVEQQLLDAEAALYERVSPA